MQRAMKEGPSGSAPADRSAISARGVTKAFPGVVANDGVDFDVTRGEVHALLGENGSGKTTLCKILTGLYRPDAGRVFVDGAPTHFHSPADAYAAGIFMVHQHFSLVKPMTVAENVVLGWTREGGFRFNRQDVEEEVAAAAERLDIPVDPRALISQLSVGERQRVEILKALYRGAQTLILDEPTTVLTPQEADQLFVSLRRMADAGESVVFISHKLDEVSALCDRVTVLRDGRTSGSADLREESVDARGLARLMVGHDIHFTRRKAANGVLRSDPMLEVRDVSAFDDEGNPLVDSVSLTVHPGEVLGVAGVSGNGQVALAEIITGLRKSDSGDVILDGVSLPPGDVRAAMDSGVAYVPEDRMGIALAPGLTVADNIVLRAFRRPELGHGPFLSQSTIAERTSDLLSAFNVKGTADSLVRELSGGNAQKVLLARELSSTPRLLVVATPTRGLDVSAMENIRELLAKASAEGVAILMISEDLGEILDIADRIAVICAGRIQGVLDAGTASVEEIGLLMMGGSISAGKDDE
jgi:simple sugar transport system ATP-binding protein